MDLPKWDSTLLEAASEETNVLPTICIVSPAIRARSCTIVTRMRPMGSRHLPMTQPSAYTSNELVLLIPHRRCLSSNRIWLVPSPHNVWMTSPLFRSRTISRTRWTYSVPDADPSDEAEDILTQPFPHFTQRID
jgi:hypothetical protein